MLHLRLECRDFAESDIPLVTILGQDPKDRNFWSIFGFELFSVAISEDDNHVNVEIVVLDIVKDRHQARTATASNLELSVLKIKWYAFVILIVLSNMGVTLNDMKVIVTETFHQAIYLTKELLHVLRRRTRSVETNRNTKALSLRSLKIRTMPSKSTIRTGPRTLITTRISCDKLAEDILPQDLRLN